MRSPEGKKTRNSIVRKRFYDAAEPLFARHGFRKTTIEEICRAARASKRTFYSQFESKTDLFVRLFLAIAADLVTRWREEMAGTPQATATARVAGLIDAYLVLAREHPVFEILFAEPEVLAGLAGIAGELIDTPLHSALREVIEEGIARGEFRPLDAGRATWMVYSLLDSMFFLVPMMLATRGALEDRDLIREVRAFILHGLGGRP